MQVFETAQIIEEEVDQLDDHFVTNLPADNFDDCMNDQVRVQSVTASLC